MSTPMDKSPEGAGGGAEKQAMPAHSPPPETPGTRPRSTWFYVWSLAGCFLLLLVLLIAGLLIYASTSEFSNVVRKKVIAVLEDSTGGRVELQSFHWSLFGLAVEADNLTIHGLEGPGEAPYAHIDRLYVKARILSFFRPKVDLNYLEADHPVVHLIVYPDGSTNQPKPKTREKSEASLPDTIFDLKIQRLEVNKGLALVNQRAIPFNLRADDLGAVVTYAPAKDHYLGDVQVGDLSLERGSVSPVRSKLHLQVEVARNAAEIRALHFTSGESQLDASGSLKNFAAPQWTLATQGSVDLRDAAALSGIDGLERGTVDLNLEGQGTADGRFSIGGKVRLINGAYHDSYVVLTGVDAAGGLRVTPDEIAIDGIQARLREGGSVDAALHITHWDEPVVPAPPVPASPVPSKGKARIAPAAIKPAFSIRAHVHGARLSSVLRVVAIRRYQDLGYDTAAEGAVNIDWSGPADDFTLAANLQLSAPSVRASGDVPVSGLVVAKYFQRSGTVEISQLEAHTQGTTAQVSGLLAVYPISRSSALQVKATATNLVEFDRVLTDLGLSVNGKKGVAAIPVQLHGQAEFDGTVSGSLIDPDVKGHVIAANISMDLDLAGVLQSSPATPVQRLPVSSPEPLPGSVRWDRVDATGEYSPSLISIERALVTKGAAKIDIHGTLAADVLSHHRMAFDGSSRIDATAGIHGTSVTDLMAMAGQSVPVTGMVNLQVHAGGRLDDLTGGGDVEVQGGEIAGEPYHGAAANLSFVGRQIELVRLTLRQDGGTAIANGTYDLETRRFLVNLDGTNFELAHFHHLQNSGFPVTGALKFDAHASGTLAEPSVLAGVHLTNLTVEGQPVGGVEAVVHSQGKVAYFSAHSTLAAAHVELSGQTVLRDNYDTQAKLIFSGFDIDPFLKLFNVQQITGHSLIAGSVDVSGPAKEPKQFSGDAEIDQFSVTLENITLNSQGPLRASCRDGLVRITQAHITGPDTNMSVSGTADLLRERDLDLSASGSINMKLAQTFDSDIISSGHVDFNVEAYGTLMKPLFTGQVNLTDVAMALNDVPTGISKLNGTLVFDQDRLEVKNLVGATGGGQLKLAGFITYQRGIYGDLTATGKDIRIRYSGVSTTADTTMHLQGSQANMLLSGNVQITRFIIGPNLDFALFTNAGGASPPPNPNAPANHVRLDIRITSSPQLDFQNSYAQLAGSVDLRIRGTVAQPAVLGRINITEGTANFAGTTYQLQRGDINFTNPVRIEPIIDIDATTRIQEYDVTVGLHGSTAHLTPTFRSEPPLPQGDVISLLALGRTQEEQQLYSQDEENSGINSTSNALLGGALNATVSSRMQKLFGVGSVKIDPTYLGNLGDSTARITVQQNISRNLQLTYATNVNTTAEQLIQAQINLTTTVSILAVRDESDVFSLVLKVHKRFR